MPSRGVRAVIAERLVRLPAASIEDIDDFGRRSVSVDVLSDGSTLVAIPHAPYRGAPGEQPSGPSMAAMVRRREVVALAPGTLGDLVLDRVAAVREHAPA